MLDLVGDLIPSGQAAEITGSAGGGAVTVTLNGLRSATSVHISEAALADHDLLEELVAAAITDALSKAGTEGRDMALGLLGRLQGKDGPGSEPA